MKTAISESFAHARRGLRYLLATERNAKIHLWIASVTAISGWLLQISRIEWLILIMTCGIVISLEALNTAIELLSDVVSPQRNVQIGKVKDLAAGSVLCAAVAAAGVGLIIFLPKISAYWNLEL